MSKSGNIVTESIAIDLFRSHSTKYVHFYLKNNIVLFDESNLNLFNKNHTYIFDI